jgi:hypothetical protein
VTGNWVVGYEVAEGDGSSFNGTIEGDSLG